MKTTTVYSANQTKPTNTLCVKCQVTIKEGSTHSYSFFVSDGRKILKWILKKQGVPMWTGFIWLRKGTSEHSNELKGSMKGRES
jgi:hypothetical protein